MNRSALRRGLSVTTTLAAISLGAWPANAFGAPPSKSQAQRLAKRAASRYVERYGISYPPSTWIAGCTRQPGRWVCGVHTDTGQCFGSVHVVGTAAKPRARKARVYCGE